MLDRDILNAASVPDAEIWQAAILSTVSGGASTWEHPCWQRDASAPALVGGLPALRSCVEEERARAPPSETMLARLRRLAAAHHGHDDEHEHGDDHGCPSVEELARPMVTPKVGPRA